MTYQRGPEVSGISQVQIRLLGSFGVSIEGRRAALPLSAQRVIVALALRPQEIDRMALGAMLYPDARQSHVSASLRSALWRTKRAAGRAVIDSRGQHVRLAEGIEVDLQAWTQQARMLTAPQRSDLVVDVAEVVHALSQELLPAWNEEWLILERQRWDNLRLHALERLADEFAIAGRHVEALEAGHAAVAIEPYRESAYRAVIRAYIAEGNNASALALYHRCRRLLLRDLGVSPTSQIQALVRSIAGD
jgi:DNA-binding SARP family transcriptional activator